MPGDVRVQHSTFPAILAVAPPGGRKKYSTTGYHASRCGSPTHVARRSASGEPSHPGICRPSRKWVTGSRPDLDGDADSRMSGVAPVPLWLSEVAPVWWLSSAGVAVVSWLTVPW